ncbi:MAG: polysaccharide deacetylase family protein [Candidatus Peregrinibacteria bacterium]|nr:polysaccharide deacetylase family protein [Candidatus Peregrinibacteria bacterium]
MKVKILSISLIATFYALCIILVQGTFAISQAKAPWINQVIPSLASNKPVDSVQVPILTYHYIRTVTDKKDVLGARLSVTPAIFEEQLQTLVSEGYHSITLDDLNASWKSQFVLPTKPIILTFDDGYDDFYINAYPLLQKYQIKATAYIVPNFLNKVHYMTSAQIKELSRSPLITIAAHTMNHADLRKTNTKVTTQEVLGSKVFLEKLIGKTVNHFAYPFGKYTDSTVKIVEKSGFTTATTMKRGNEHKEKDRLTTTRIEIIGGDSLEIFKKSILLR